MAKTVLLVDDSSTVRRQVRLALESSGYACIEAENGAEGLQKLHNSKPNAIICDVNMPVMGGLEMLEMLPRELAKSLPILMLTTECGSQLVKDAKAHGAKGWIIKPFTPADVLKALNKLLG